MSELSHYEKTGYLHDDFKIFHLKDTSMRPIDFHYHDFHLSQRKYFLQCGRTYL